MNSNTKGKASKAILEIFVIVFSISISIWLNNFNESRNEKKEADKFLIELVSDLKNDIQILSENNIEGKKLVDNYAFLLSVTDTTKESSIGPRTTFNFDNTNLNVARYEGFKSSGKLTTISDDKLKNKILIYYQQTIPNLIQAYEFTKYLQLEILRKDIEGISLNNFYQQQRVVSITNNLKYNFEENIRASNKAIEELKEIISLIHILTGRNNNYNI